MGQTVHVGRDDGTTFSANGLPVEAGQTVQHVGRAETPLWEIGAFCVVEETVEELGADGDTIA